MPREDAVRWNARYREQIRQYLQQPRDLLVRFAHLLPASGRALDLAMGLGANALFLYQHGLQVVGIDISWVALKYVKTQFPFLDCLLADLTEFSMPKGSVQVILDFYYLERSLWPLFHHWLVPGGLLFFESLHEDMLHFKSDINPRHLLKEGELLQAFHDWEIIYYNEGVLQGYHGRKAVSSLIARRPI